MRLAIQCMAHRDPARICIYVHTCTCTQRNVYICIYKYMYVYLFVKIKGEWESILNAWPTVIQHVYVDMYMHVHLDRDTYIYAYINTNMYTNWWIYIQRGNGTRYSMHGQPWFSTQRTIFVCSTTPSTPLLAVSVSVFADLKMVFFFGRWYFWAVSPSAPSSASSPSRCKTYTWIHRVHTQSHIRTHTRTYSVLVCLCVCVCA